MAQPARVKSRSSEAMRLKAQKKTDFEQEFYQSLFSEALDGIFVCDQRGKYLNVNPRGRQMLGYTRREILRMSLSDVIPPEHLKTNPIRMTDLLAGKTVVNERRLRCKNGRLLHVEISAWMLSNGNLVGIVRDISEQKATE